MTADKDFKRRVRERARRTGESYVTAQRRLLSHSPTRSAVMAEHYVPVEFDHLYQVEDVGPTYHFAALREVDGDRLVLIWMQPDVANAIVQGALGVRGRRPMTHDLLAETVAALGALQEVRISLQQDEGEQMGTFVAELRVQPGEGQPRSFDARPSDALAVALRTRPLPRLLADDAAFTGNVLPPGALSLDQIDEAT